MNPLNPHLNPNTEALRSHLKGGATEARRRGRHTHPLRARIRVNPTLESCLFADSPAPRERGLRPCSAYLPKAVRAGEQHGKLCSQTKCAATNCDLEQVWLVPEPRFFICGMGRPRIT